MASEQVLVAERRELLGTSNSRRLRKTGRVPANLYGLGEECVSLTVAADVVTPLIVSGTAVVDLELEGSAQKVFIRDVQWDTFLTSILHLDFQRVSADQRINIELGIETRGVVNDGVLEQPLHSIPVNCPAAEIPETLSVRVGSLAIGDEVTVGDLDLPDGVTTEVAADTVVLRVVAAQDVDIVQEDVLAAAEPEVIGKAKDEEDSEE